MNYEDLYQSYQALAKDLKDKTALVQRLQKAVNKEIENGDLRSFDKDMELLQEACSEQARILEEMKALVAQFDRQAYMEGGDYAEQMLACCEESGVDVKGEFPVYEMFPYRVRFDVENLDIYLDRKKVHCLRPVNFVQRIKTGQDKLMKASFNANVFANELAEAYDMAVLKLGKRPETDLYLTKLYKLLAPMGRYRREYDQQSYAFDLARLYASGVEETKDGRRFEFGPSRNINQAIRILDQNGQEQYLATIRFFSKIDE
ncbi:hypothetical protein NXH76_14665 [Blautia schinkii]|nr:hypothetical protein [Blautia schinkii]